MELLIENVRSFSEKSLIPIKPLTLLTGENSSGKSTFLAALAAVVDQPGFPLRPRFNEPPYNLGNYDSIATYKGGRYGRATSFSLGIHQDDGPHARRKGERETSAVYVSNQGRAECSSVTWADNAMTAKLSLSDPENDTEGRFRVRWEVTQAGTTEAREVATSVSFGSSTRLDIDELLFRSFFSEQVSKSSNKDRDLYMRLGRLFSDTQNSGMTNVVSIAPIRTKPKRTYDQINEDFTPEGEHIPFVIQNLLNNAALKETFERFGTESGLYKKLSVKKLGYKGAGPVQVMVTNEGRTTNLLDVGYGVSQALPVIVESLLAPISSLLLLQQPEVHLHPRAQAALGSLFVDLYKNQRKSFVIETHSDYIIDRIRQEVAKGEIRPADVEILYFEKHGSDTKFYPISLDKNGNIADAPPSYRQFFLREELNLLSRTGF